MNKSKISKSINFLGVTISQLKTDSFDQKGAFRTITLENDQLHITGAVAAALAQFAWYAIYFIYLPEHRLTLFIWQFLAMILPIIICFYRKKLSLNGAQCQLISAYIVASVTWCLINICPPEIRIIVFLGASMLFLGPAFLAIWPMSYYLSVVIISIALDLIFYFSLGYLSVTDFLFNNIFPTVITIIIGAFMLNNRMQILLKKERMKWSLAKSEKQLSLINQKTKTELEFLIYSISHDLRSPILSVKGLLMLIKDYEKLNPENFSYLKMAEDSVDRLDQTIYDILDFADNAKIELKNEQFNMREMVDEIFKDLKFLSKQPIKFQIEIDGPDIVFSDKKRLKTIIKNLASNAVKYSSTDIDNAYVKFKMQQTKDTIEFQVEDNGRGVPPEQQQKIFEMFYRYANDISGSGLGLFIVKEVLSKLCGEIELESTVNVGSTFKVTVPLKG